MSSNVVQTTNFNTANITFSPPKSLDSGAKTAYLNYDGRSLIAQTASMNIPYGINKFDKNGPVKYSVDLSFRGAEDGSNKKMKAFYDMIAALDEYMIDQGVKNSQLWFREKLGREVVKRFYTPMVRISKDANGNPKPYPPTFKVSLKQRRGSEAFEVQVYDENKQPYLDGEGNPAPVSNVLVKGAQVTCLIQCTGVWFAGTSKYGLSWKVVQIRTDSIPESMNGCGFADEDEDGDVPSKPVRRSQPAPSSMPALEDDEEVDDDEAFSAPVPAPVAKKQSVLAAVAAPAPVAVAPVAVSMDDEAEDVEPVPVPKKKIVTAKKIVAKAKA